MDRASDLDRFYDVLEDLRRRLGGYRYLRDCVGRDGWPSRGIYFFFEPGETRGNGHTPRVVRVGTHAVSRGSRTTLWNRLAQHRGQVGGARSGGGNHRGSIFRWHVGTALLNRDPAQPGPRGSWGRSTANRLHEILDGEYGLEQAVSVYIGAMPFLWLAVLDEPGAGSDRAVIESNAIALLSNRNRVPIDPPSSVWLGHHADRAAVRESGLWNVNHVDGSYAPAFLERFALYVTAI